MNPYQSLSDAILHFIKMMENLPQINTAEDGTGHMSAVLGEGWKDNE